MSVKRQQPTSKTNKHYEAVISLAFGGAMSRGFGPKSLRQPGLFMRCICDFQGHTYSTERSLISRRSSFASQGLAATAMS